MDYYLENDDTDIYRVMQEVKITSADINDEQLKRLYEGAFPEN